WPGVPAPGATDRCRSRRPKLANWSGRVVGAASLPLRILRAPAMLYQRRRERGKVRSAAWNILRKVGQESNLDIVRVVKIGILTHKSSPPHWLFGLGRQQFLDFLGNVLLQGRRVADVDAADDAFLVDDQQRRERLHIELLREFLGLQVGVVQPHLL